jgi:uncharacterized Ntn-hydrolase superfamily protein
MFMTFSIVAYDPDKQEWGVAVASKFLAAAAVVSWAQGGVGAVATQALAKVSFGPDGLSMMAQGMSAQETLDMMIAADKGGAHRQVAFVDNKGNVAVHTGPECLNWAGHQMGKYFSCQGNILTGGNTLDAMAEAFTSAEGELSDKLLTALLAGDTVGGDSRGKQSAGLLVVKIDGGYGGDNDRYIDLRVDDDPEPVKKLSKLLGAHHLFFGESKADDLLPITAEIATELQAILSQQGYFSGETSGLWDDASKRAFWAMVGNENLEERWNIEDEPDKIDRVALEYIRGRFKA